MKISPTAIEVANALAQVEAAKPAVRMIYPDEYRDKMGGLTVNPMRVEDSTRNLMARRLANPKGASWIQRLMFRRK